MEIVLDFVWDEDKHRANLAKHRIDFVDMQALFDGRPDYTSESPRFGETRFATTGELDGQFYTVIWTWRGDVVRLISARRARDGEERAYRAAHGR